MNDEPQPVVGKKVISPIDEDAIKRDLATTQPESPVVALAQDVPDQPLNIAQPVGEIGVEQEPTVGLAPPATPAEISSVTTDDSSQKKRFPWVRALLIGLLLPIVTFAGIVRGLATISDLLRSGVFVGSAISPIWLIQAIPYIVSGITAVIAILLLSKMKVRYPFFLSVGTLLISYAVLAIQKTLTESPFGLSWGWGESDSVSVAGNVLRIVLPVIGVIAMALLVIPTNYLSRRIPTWAVLIVTVAIVALPFGINVLVQNVQPTPQDKFEAQFNQSYTLKDYQEGSAEKGDGWPLMPTSLYPGYDADMITRCLKEGLIISATKECIMNCVGKIEDGCVDITIKSGQYNKEHENYTYKDGKCDPGNFGYVSVWVHDNVTDAKLKQPQPVECRKLSTPGGRTLYAEALPNKIRQYYSMDYYFIEGQGTVYLGVFVNGPKGQNYANLSAVPLAEADLLKFVDTFEVVSRQ